MSCPYNLMLSTSEYFVLLRCDKVHQERTLFYVSGGESVGEYLGEMGGSLEEHKNRLTLDSAMSVTLCVYVVRV